MWRRAFIKLLFASAASFVQAGKPALAAELARRYIQTRREDSRRRRSRSSQPRRSA
jgi:hypothetical protein